RLGIGFLPWFPLATGELAQAGGLLEQIAARHRATPAQVALAWVLGRGENLVPIPGTTKAARVDENAGALAVVLDADDVRALEGIAERVAGDRNSAAGMATIDR
nr:aldo/keto reductase [Candidatus Eremiobacteraeota bacterium]